MVSEWSRIQARPALLRSHSCIIYDGLRRASDVPSSGQAVPAEEEPAGTGGDLARFQGKWAAKCRPPEEHRGSLHGEPIVAAVRFHGTGAVTSRARGRSGSTRKPSPHKTMDWLSLAPPSPNGEDAPENLGLYQTHGRLTRCGSATAAQATEQASPNSRARRGRAPHVLETLKRQGTTMAKKPSTPAAQRRRASGQSSGRVDDQGRPERGRSS